MSLSETKSVEKRASRRSIAIAHIMGFSAMLMPMFYMFEYNSLDTTWNLALYAPLWTFYAGEYQEFFIAPWNLIFAPYVTVLRLWFVYEMFRYHNKGTSRRRPFIVGLISEFYFLLPWALNYLFISPSNPILWGSGFGPFPLPLLIGLILLIPGPPLKGQYL